MYKKILLLLFVALTTLSCEYERSEDFFDVDGGQTIGAFNNSANDDLIISPTDDFVTPVVVGVSTVSNQNRTATISIDPNSTLDPSIYSLESTTVTIPAGSFTGTVNITTVAGSSFANSDVLIINLDSVQGGTVLDNANTVDQITFRPTVGCTFIAADTIGVYQITVNELGVQLNPTFEVIEGPGNNQVTFKNLFGHTNPETGEQDYDIIVDITPNSGNANVVPQAAWHTDNLAFPPYGEGRIQGPGKVLSCTGTIEFTFTHTVDAGSFGPRAFAAVKL